MSAELINFSLKEDGTLVTTQNGQPLEIGKINEVTIALAQTRNESGMPQVVRVVKMLIEDKPLITIGKPSANLKVQEFIVPVVETVQITEDN